MSVRKRKWTHNGVTNEKWVVDYSDMGGKRRLKTFDTKKDADRFKREVENELEAGIHVPARATKTVAEAADQFLRWYETRWKIGEITGGTVHNIEDDARHRVIPAFGRLKLTDVTTDIVQAAIVEWATHYSRRTVERGVICIKLLLNFAVTKRWIKRNVLKDNPPKMPKPDGRRVPIPDKDAIRAITHTLGSRHFRDHRLTHRNRIAIIFLATFCGMREGEILGLHWEDVDFTRNIIRVRNSLSRYDGLKAPKSLAGNRQIRMPGLVRYALLQVLDYWQVESILGEGTRSAIQQRRVRALDRSSGADLAKGVPTGLVICRPEGKPLNPNSTTTNYLHPVLRDAGLWPDGQKKRLSPCTGCVMHSRR